MSKSHHRSPRHLLRSLLAGISNLAEKAKEDLKFFFELVAALSLVLGLYLRSPLHPSKIKVKPENPLVIIRAKDFLSGVNGFNSKIGSELEKRLKMPPNLVGDQTQICFFRELYHLNGDNISPPVEEQRLQNERIREMEKEIKEDELHPPKVGDVRPISKIDLDDMNREAKFELHDIRSALGYRDIEQPPTPRWSEKMMQGFRVKEGFHFPLSDLELATPMFFMNQILPDLGSYSCRFYAHDPIDPIFQRAHEPRAQALLYGQMYQHTQIYSWFSAINTSDQAIPNADFILNLTGIDGAKLLEQTHSLFGISESTPTAGMFKLSAYSFEPGISDYKLVGVVAKAVVGQDRLHLVQQDLFEEVSRYFRKIIIIAFGIVVGFRLLTLLIAGIRMLLGDS